MSVEQQQAYRLDDPRLKILLERQDSVDYKLTKKVGIIGVPFDEGVSLNGGRVGAKYGPDVVRKFLPKAGPIYNPEFDLDISELHLRDLGNVTFDGSVKEMHEALEKKVYDALTEGYLPICIGGGNDQSYPNGKALFSYLKNKQIITDSSTNSMTVINIDAHLDVRQPIPSPHSGSPFRQLLQIANHKMKLIEFASQGSQCSKEHSDFVIKSGGEIHWLSRIRENGGALKNFQILMDNLASSQVFFSFDIDSIASSDCPGVSCPAVIGLNSQEALDICLEAGKRKNVVLMDISEFNPTVEDYRTGRLIANMIYYFLLGYAQR